MMKFGLDSYSFHLALAAGRYDIFRTLDWLENRGFSGLQININGPDGRFLGRDPSDLAHVRRVRTTLEQKGFFAEVGGGHASEPDTVARQLHLAADLGADTLRTVVGFDTSLAHTMDRTRRSLEASLPLARQLGVRIAVENHEDITAAELHELLESIDDPLLGICLDTGNDLVVYGDPLDGARLLAPRAMTTHLKDQKLVRVGATIYSVGVRLGTGDVDLPAILQVIKKESTLDRLLLQNCTGYSAPLNKHHRPDLHPVDRYSGIPSFATAAEARTAGFLLSPDDLTSTELTAAAIKQETEIEQDLSYVRSLIT